MAKGIVTRDVISDERCNEMREQRDKKRQNEINKPNRGAILERYENEHRSQITKNEILKTKTSRYYWQQTSDEENNINDN